MSSAAVDRPRPPAAPGGGGARAPLGLDLGVLAQEVRTRLQAGGTSERGPARGDIVGTGLQDLPGRPDGAAGDERLHAVVARVVQDRGALLGPSALAATVRGVRDLLFGAGPLQPWLDDPLVTDVLVNAPADVWVERAGRLVRTEVHLGTAADVRELAVRLAAAGGQRLDDASPTVDARLPDGTRLHALLPPLAGPCTVLSLRVVRRHPFTLDELVTRGTLAAGVLPVLRALVASRANLLLSGPTGSGKTTLLAALLSLVPPDQRIVVVEESGELRPDHPHVVHLATRRANVDGAGAVDLTRLVREALRMRPDRLVLGEARGAEVREVLAALNTGHEGGCATLHANTAADVPARLEALGALAGLSRDALAAQAASAVDAVLHLHRAGPDRAQRRLSEVGVVRRAGDGTLAVACAVRCHGDGSVRRGPGWDELAQRLEGAVP